MGFARNHAPRGYAVWDALRPLETQSVPDGIPPETGGMSHHFIHSATGLRQRQPDPLGRRRNQNPTDAQAWPQEPRDRG